MQIDAGSALCINKNAVHLTTEIENCHYHSFIIPVELLSPSLEGSFLNKYVKSITEYHSFTHMVLNKEESKVTSVLECLKKLDENCFHEELDDFSDYQKTIIIMELWLEFLKIVPKDFVERPRKDYDRMQTMLSYIHAHYGEEISIEKLAKKAIISKTECQRCFKKYVGQSPYQYIQEYRLFRGAKLLENSEFSITEISGMVGYASCSSFIQHFRRKYDYTPQEYRKRKRSENNRSSIGKSSF